MPAVLAGNAVIVKHSPRSPLAGDYFARAFADAGRAPISSRRSTAITLCPSAWSAIRESIGSSTPARYGAIAWSPPRRSASSMSRSSWRNDPAYVAADRRFRKTVENVVDGAIYNAGKVAGAVERVYVHRSIDHRFVEACDALRKGVCLAIPRAPRPRSARSLSPTTRPSSKPW